jgi:hypothetical protein
MSTGSKQYQEFALFIVKAVLAPDSTLPQIERMALLPDALDLWRAVLENTPNSTVDQLHPDLLNLLKGCLIPTLGLDSEARRAALEITSSYFLLIPKEFLSETAFVIELLTTQCTELTHLKPDASAEVFEVVEQLVRTAEELAGVDGVKAIADAMLTSGFFQQLIDGLSESYEAHQTTGPKAKVSNVQGQVETDFFGILARIMYASPELFLRLIESINHTSEVDKTMNWLLEEWFSVSQHFMPRDQAINFKVHTCIILILSASKIKVASAPSSSEVCSLCRGRTLHNSIQPPTLKIHLLTITDSIPRISQVIRLGKN